MVEAGCAMRSRADFDETLVGSRKWDSKRLVASSVVAARAAGLDDSDGLTAALDCTAEFRSAMAKMGSYPHLWSGTPGLT